MIKVFKIIEKIVWALTIITIVIVLIFGAIALCRNYDYLLSVAIPIIPYLYAVAGIVVFFKAAILGVKIYFEGKIEERTAYLQTIIENQQAQQKNQDEKVTGKLDKIIEGIEAIPSTDSEPIVDYLKANLHNVVTELVNQQVALKAQQLELEYQKKEADLERRSLTVDAIIKSREHFERINQLLREKEQLEREAKLKKTEEYAQQFFLAAKTSVEDVEKVCQVIRLFIEHGHIPVDRDTRIAYNKNIRNAELKQFVANIITYNKKENLDSVRFLKTYFCDWFTGKRENIQKNYNVLPKDSLVSKEGLEADLESLRANVSFSENKFSSNLSQINLQD